MNTHTHTLVSSNFQIPGFFKRSVYKCTVKHEFVAVSGISVAETEKASKLSTDVTIFIP